MPFLCSNTVSTHSRAKAAANNRRISPLLSSVSTHSRTKAAASLQVKTLFKLIGFNTQPHEGGCRGSTCFLRQPKCFNTQPHEGGCAITPVVSSHAAWFQHTAARRRLPIIIIPCSAMIGFNTQPHEGGCSRHCDRHFGQNGFNTQPHEGGCFLTANFQLFTKSFNTQPHEGGCQGA